MRIYLTIVFAALFLPCMGQDLPKEVLASIHYGIVTQTEHGNDDERHNIRRMFKGLDNGNDLDYKLMVDDFPTRKDAQKTFFKNYLAFFDCDTNKLRLSFMDVLMMKYDKALVAAQYTHSHYYSSCVNQKNAEEKVAEEEQTHITEYSRKKAKADSAAKALVLLKKEIRSKSYRITDFDTTFRKRTQKVLFEELAIRVIDHSVPPKCSVSFILEVDTNKKNVSTIRNDCGIATTLDEFVTSIPIPICERGHLPVQAQDTLYANWKVYSEGTVFVKVTEQGSYDAMVYKVKFPSKTTLTKRQKELIEKEFHRNHTYERTDLAGQYSIKYTFAKLKVDKVEDEIYDLEKRLIQ